MIHTSKDGATCLFDSTHLIAHSDVIPLLSEALAKVNIIGTVGHVLTVDMGRIVGNSICVATGPDDDIYYKTRVARRWPSRFVRGRLPIPCSSITLVFKQSGPKGSRVRVVTAFIGTPGAREEGDTSLRSESEIQESKAFWANHALIE
jgi:hypothetical protein